jgi:hypothetical protein
MTQYKIIDFMIPENSIDLISDHRFYVANKDVYPPFKNGLYMEEYFFKYVIDNFQPATGEKVFRDKEGRIYIPALWTNFQIESWFHNSYTKSYMQFAVDRFISDHPSDAGYFAIIQHDEGTLLKLPANTKIYGAGIANICVPLIYEDLNGVLQNNVDSIKNTMDNRRFLASFVGSDTHGIRKSIINRYKQNPKFLISSGSWEPVVNTNLQQLFIYSSLASKFVLCPRGYGRSSFRFFEVIKMKDCGIPVYIWNDIEWLPYKEIIDYSRFSISIHDSKLADLEHILERITDEKYREMKMELEKIRSVFNMDFMCKYICEGIA